MEIKLFMEFQYRFNPSWQPKPYQEQLYEYADIAQYWAISKKWARRPWRSRKFPSTAALFNH